MCIFYHTAGIENSLRSELERVLGQASATQLAQRSTCVSDQRIQWAVVHRRQHQDDDVKAKYQGLNLVVYLVQDAPGCECEREASYCHVSSGTYWRAGTQTVINHFASLKAYVKGCKVQEIKDLDPSGWIPRHESVSALAILCQGYLAVAVVRGVTDRDEIKKAIRWEDISEPVRSGLNRDEKWKRVSSSDWWTTPFQCGEAVNLEALRAELCREMEVALLPDGVSCLLAAFAKANNDLTTPEIVFEAYKALVEKRG